MAILMMPTAVPAHAHIILHPMDEEALLEPGIKLACTHEIWSERSSESLVEIPVALRVFVNVTTLGRVETR